MLYLTVYDKPFLDHKMLDHTRTLQSKHSATNSWLSPGEPDVVEKRACGQTAAFKVPVKQTE